MRRAVALLAAALVAAAGAQPAFADDPLIVSGNSSPQSIYAVVDDTALYGGFFKEEHLDVTIQYKNRPGQVATALAGSQFVASGAAETPFQCPGKIASTVTAPARSRLRATLTGNRTSPPGSARIVCRSIAKSSRPGPTTTIIC